MEKIITNEMIIHDKFKKKKTKKKKFFFKILCIIFLLILFLLILKYEKSQILVKKNQNVLKENQSQMVIKESESQNVIKEKQIVTKESENQIVLKETQSQIIIKEGYYCCFCAIGRKENLYSRELISYYMSIGVEKFVFIDNNLPNTEKLSDVLQDYINNGTVDIIEMLGSGIGHAEFFGIMYDKYQNKCNWLTFFDFDEYLVLFSEERKELSLKEFLSNKKFDHCDAIEFNWVNYGDNNLYYYDNRSSIERFTEPNFDDYSNRFVKSIIRGYLNKKVFIPGRTNHQPIRYIKLCNSKGEIASYYPDCLIPPIYKYGYLKHFHTRTADEYADKVVRGHPGNQALDINERVNLFFSKNRFSEEKLKIFEKKFNRTFNYIHWKKN